MRTPEEGGLVSATAQHPPHPHPLPGWLGPVGPLGQTHCRSGPVPVLSLLHVLLSLHPSLDFSRVRTGPFTSIAAQVVQERGWLTNPLMNE